MDDMQRQLSNIGKGIVQINLRLSRLAELVEAGTSAGAEAGSQQGPALELLFDLLRAVDQTLAVPVAPASWWERLLGTAPPAADLEGLSLARDHVLAQLRLADIQPIATDGPADPRLHQVVEVQAPTDPALAGTIARTHCTGWVRKGNPPHVLRLAQVTAWKRTES